MLTATAEPFVDTTPADLSHSLTHDRLPALAVKSVGPLELRVLGASHQVALDSWIETVACHRGRVDKLPGDTKSCGYTFTSEVTMYERQELARQVAELRQAMTRHPGGLAVAFAGDPLAITAITAEVTSESANWQTWHVYPNTGEIVTTQSSLQLAMNHESQRDTHAHPCPCGEPHLPHGSRKGTLTP